MVGQQWVNRLVLALAGLSPFFSGQKKENYTVGPVGTSNFVMLNHKRPANVDHGNCWGIVYMSHRWFSLVHILILGVPSPFTGIKMAVGQNF